MIAFGYYLLKVTLSSGILFGYYRIALRNKLFHQWNRFFLMVTLLLSLSLPLHPFSIAVNTGESKVVQLLTVVDRDEFVVVSTKGSGFLISPEQWTGFGYFMVSLALLVSSILFLIRLRRILRSHSPQRMDDIFFVNTEEKGTPFSFFHYIVWNKNISLASESGQQIFKHEVVHVKEKHSYDKVFCLLVLIPFWVNPFFWLIRKELYAIHEFIADKKSLQSYDTTAFAKMILQSTYSQQFQNFTNPFFQSSIKRRLTMLAKYQNPKINYFGRILVLPLLALLVLAFTVKAKNVVKENNLRKISKNENQINQNQIISLTPSESFNNQQKFKALASDTIPTLQYKGKIIKEVTVIKSVEKTDINLVFQDGSKETISESDAIKANLITKQATIFTAPVIKKDSSVSIKNVVVENISVPVKDTGNITIKGPYNTMLILIDAEVFNGTWEQLPVAQKDIQSINIMKGEDLVKEYGAKAKNGVLAIITKAYFEKMEKEREKNPPIFTKTEVEPKFNGDWPAFLMKNLNAKIPAINKAPNGTYTVIVQFIVNVDGTLSDMKALTEHGHGMEDEVFRVLKVSPNWLPAVQNGKKVRVYHKQPITFVVTEKNDGETTGIQEQKIPLTKVKLDAIKSMKNISQVTIDGYEIVRFTLVVGTDNGGVKEHINEGKIFDEETKQMLANLKSGDLFFFESIRGIKNGSEKRFPAQMYKAE
jgi:hypothetical protein